MKKERRRKPRKRAGRLRSHNRSIGVKGDISAPEKTVDEVRLSAAGVLMVLDEGFCSGIELPSECIVVRSRDDRVTLSDPRDGNGGVKVLVVFSHERALSRYMSKFFIRRQDVNVFTYRCWDDLIQAYCLAGYDYVHIDPTGNRHLPVREIPFAPSAELYSNTEY